MIQIGSLKNRYLFQILSSIKETTLYFMKTCKFSSFVHIFVIVSKAREII